MRVTKQHSKAGIDYAASTSTKIDVPQQRLTTLHKCSFLIMFLVSLITPGCANNQDSAPTLLDSNVAGRHLPKAELTRCDPSTTTGPIIKSARLPKYPAAEFFNNKTGEVVIKFDVTEIGTTADIQIIRSTSEGFGIQVGAAVENWRFAPALAQDVPTRVTCIQKHQFARSQAR